jgi:hypothetical protein
MNRLLYSHCEILLLAARSNPGPMLPAPDCIRDGVNDLLGKGLLELADDCLAITETGREALEANADRVTEIEGDLRLAFASAVPPA